MLEVPDTIGTPRAPMAPPDSPTTRRGVAWVLLRHASTKTILVSAIPLLATRLALGGFGAADGWAALGVAVVWPAFEWALHVGLHLAPFRIGRWRIDPPLCRTHRLHHLYPGVVDYLLLPPRFLAGLAALAWIGMPLLLGLRPGLTAAVMFHVCGLLNGWVHLLTHTRVRPRSRYYAWVRRTHHLHHFKDHRRWFAFTGPWMDGPAAVEALRRR